MRGLFAERALRRRVVLLLITEFLWGTGAFFVLPTTTMPAYVRSLGASHLVVGIVGIAMVVLFQLPQLFARSALQPFRHRKRGLILLHIVLITPYLLIPVADLLLAQTHRSLLLILVVGLLAFSQFVMGLVVPVWLDMLAQVIPLPVRGSYFGLSSGLFAIGGIQGGAALIALEHWLGPDVFRGAFVATGILYLASMAVFSLAPIPETAFAYQRKASPLAGIRQALANAHPRTDYGRFVLSSMGMALAMTVVPFLVVYATDAHGLHLPSSIFSRITLWQAMGGAMGAILLGTLVDRLGPRWPWMGVTLIIPLLMVLYPLGGARPVLIGCSLLVGVLTMNWAVSGPSMLELSPDGDKSTYVAITNLAGVLPATIGPLAVAEIIERWGYRPAFAVAACGALAACLAALTIRGRARTRAVATPELSLEA